MATQTICSVYEFPAGKKSDRAIFEEFSHLKISNEYDPDYKVQVAGADIGIRGAFISKSRTVVIITYDSDSDLITNIKLRGIKGITIRKVNRTVDLTGKIIK